MNPKSPSPNRQRLRKLHRTAIHLKAIIVVPDTNTPSSVAVPDTKFQVKRREEVVVPDTKFQAVAVFL
jgi:hypothetical protein